MLLQMSFVVWLVFFSKWQDQLLSIPQKYLVGLQIFRIFVELILAELAARAIFPTELTYHGINFDIFAGFAAALTYVAIKYWGEQKIKEVILSFNILGIILLANIGFHAVLIMPTSFQQFQYSVPPTVLATFPMQLLPFFLVPVAMALHLVSINKALRAK